MNNQQTPELRQTCELVATQLQETVRRAGLENDPLGRVVEAQVAFTRLLPVAIESVRSQPVDAMGVRKAVQGAAQAALRYEARKFLAAMVIGGISLVTAAGLAGFLVGRDVAQENIQAAGRVISLNGAEARAIMGLVESNPGTVSASLRSAPVRRDERTGLEVIQPSLWRHPPPQAPGP